MSLSSRNPRCRSENLWRLAEHQVQRAIQTGALYPLTSKLTLARQSGLVFQLRSITNRQASPIRISKEDPFEPPWEKDLLVAAVPPSHAILLNKFPVFRPHLLLVTKMFKPQDNWPDASDFRALASLVTDDTVLAYYNGGPTAGASQSHRHFQALRLPLVREQTARFPTEPIVQAALTGHALPFKGTATRLTAKDWQDDSTPVRLTLKLAQLAHKVGLDSSVGKPEPFNLILTRYWMLLIPRRRATVCGINLNSLAYLGAFLVKDRNQIPRLLNTGLLNVLNTATGDAAP